MTTRAQQGLNNWQVKAQVKGNRGSHSGSCSSVPPEVVSGPVMEGIGLAGLSGVSPDSLGSQRKRQKWMHASNPTPACAP